MSVCKICELKLIKQYVNFANNGDILTEEETDGLKRYNESFSKTLKCTGCGALCYKRINPPESGWGLCKRCGGTHLIRRPKDIEDFTLLEKYGPYRFSKIWSCPVHGCK